MNFCGPPAGSGGDLGRDYPELTLLVAVVMLPGCAALLPGRRHGGGV